MNQTHNYTQEQMLKDINRQALLHNQLPEVIDGEALIEDLSESMSQLKIHPLDRFRQEISEKEDKLKDLQQQLIDLENQIGKHGNQDQKLSLQLKDLKKRFQDQNKIILVERDMNEYKEKINDLSEQLRIHTNKKIQNQYVEILNNVQQIERQKLQQQLEQIEQDLVIISKTDYKKYLNHKINCLSDINDEAQKYETQINEYQQINQQLKDKTIELQKELICRQDELKTKAQEYNKIKESYERQDKQYESRKQKLDQLILKNQEIIENTSQIYTPQQRENYKSIRQVLIGLLISVIIYILFIKL